MATKKEKSGKQIIREAYERKSRLMALRLAQTHNYISADDTVSTAKRYLKYIEEGK